MWGEQVHACASVGVYVRVMCVDEYMCVCVGEGI